jgi:hypothetical protein
MAYDIGSPVIHWFDHNGFDGYTREAVENRATGKTRSGARYGHRPRGVWDISQFVVHHSGGDGPTPAGMFQTLWRDRWLSVHFAIEDDGRIYQFLDPIELAWHAGSHNKISVGVECCLYPLASQMPDFYSAENCKRRGNLPHTIGHYVRHGQKIKSFEMPSQQVFALASLVAGVYVALDLEPRPPKFPRGVDGAIPTGLAANPLAHKGMIGHYHCTKNKIDPLGIDLVSLENDVADLCLEFGGRGQCR